MVMRITSTAWPVWLSTVPANTRDEIGIADRHRQRGVLGEVEILAGQRRDDDAHRLRDDDEPQRLPLAQAERGCGLLLAARHADDAAAHDLGDEARRCRTVSPSSSAMQVPACIAMPPSKLKRPGCG